MCNNLFILINGLLSNYSMIYNYENKCHSKILTPSPFPTIISLICNPQNNHIANKTSKIET